MLNLHMLMLPPHRPESNMPVTRAVMMRLPSADDTFSIITSNESVITLNGPFDATSTNNLHDVVQSHAKKMWRVGDSTVVYWLPAPQLDSMVFENIEQNLARAMDQQRDRMNSNRNFQASLLTVDHIPLILQHLSQQQQVQNREASRSDPTVNQEVERKRAEIRQQREARPRGPNGKFIAAASPALSHEPEPYQEFEPPLP